MFDGLLYINIPRLSHNGMENPRTTIKFLASQAKSIHLYKGLRSKILKCNANIYFNKQCLAKNLTPKYATIKVPKTSKAAQSTQSKVTRIRIKDEIKFLYKKKDQLNKQLYQAHLAIAQEWGSTWHIIREYLHENINTDMDKKYRTIEQKLTKLEHIQTRTPTHTKTFYPRVTNNTDIIFTAEELTLLNKGLKYNLSYRNKNWIRTLALETETAITLLPTHEQDYIRVQAAHNLKQIYKQQSAGRQYNSNHAKREYIILNHIKEKLSTFGSFTFQPKRSVHVDLGQIPANCNSSFIAIIASSNEVTNYNNSIQYS